jgi:PTS system mannose-specific IIC component
MIEPTTLGALLVWGTAVGVDLVSFPQGMLSRPLVAAGVAGLLAGDVVAGLRVGVLLELFELDVLPIGATRYPDLGPPAVAATALAAFQPWREVLGIAVPIALLLALVGGGSVDALRRANGRRIRRVEGALAAGDARVLARLQWQGLAADVLRSAGLTLLGLVVAAGSAPWVARVGALGRSLTLIAVSGALVAGLTGAVRRARLGRQRAWVGAGIAAGLGLLWVW